MATTLIHAVYSEVFVRSFIIHTSQDLSYKRSVMSSNLRTVLIC